MASISTAKDGTRRLIFKGTDGHRKTVYLGTVPVRWATDLRDLVESLLQHQRHDQPIPAKLSERLAGLSPELQQRLAATGLITIADDHRVTVGELLDAFTARREGAVKASTARAAAQAIRNLREFFDNRFVDEIAIRDAEAFLRHLQTTPAKRGGGTTLAPDTIHRRFKTARAVFETAVRDDLIIKNPFKFVKSRGGDLTLRQEYVPTETIMRVIDASPSTQWQLLIALSRFAGLRVPSIGATSSEMVGRGLGGADVAYHRLKERGSRWAKIQDLSNHRRPYAVS